MNSFSGSAGSVTCISEDLLQNAVHPNDFFYRGSRIGVLLVHGLTGSPTEMATVGKRLNKYGFTVSCPVLAGHCGTHEDLRATTWRDWAGSVEKAFFRLAEQTDVLFVGGLSAGALLSLHIVSRYPGHTRGLVLYSTALKWDGWGIPKSRYLLPIMLRLPYFWKRYGFTEAFPYGIKNEQLRRRVVAKMHSGNTALAGHSNTPGASVRELWRMRDVVKKHIGLIKIPTLLVHADNDDIASVRNALYVQKRLAGPTELLRLYDSYHMVTVDQERYKVADATARFFQRYLSVEEKEELASKASKNIPAESCDEHESKCDLSMAASV